MGRPRLGREAAAIARRESRCREVGQHAHDLWAAERMHAKAERHDYIHPAWCPWHEEPVGVIGPHGLAYEYTVRYLPLSCVPPWVLDTAVGSAWAALLRMRALCERFGACSKRARRAFWRGKGNVEKARAR